MKFIIILNIISNINIYIMKTIKNWNSFNESKNKCEHRNKKKH